MLAAWAVTAAAQEPACGQAPAVPPGWVHLAGGTFEMGLAEGHPSWAPVMQDPHPETVGPFWLARVPVTVRDYEACVAARACTARPRTEDCAHGEAFADHPANCVSFEQATAWCRSRGARLPTEAEFEFAVRGTAGRLHAWGDIVPDGLWGTWGSSHPVGACPGAATPEGVHDLGGNGWEWTSSAGTSAGTRVAKGGGYGDRATGANRFLHASEVQYPYLGFRCARSTAPPSGEGFVAAPAGPPPTAPPSTRTLHWSELEPRIQVETLRGPVAERVICMVAVRIDASGVPVDRKADSACPTELRAQAEAAVARARWQPRDGVEVASSVPVFIDPR